MRNLLTRAFLIIFSSSLFFLLPASSGVGDSGYPGDSKSLPKGHNQSFDDSEEEREHASILEEYHHAILPEPYDPYAPRTRSLQVAPHQLKERQLINQERGREESLVPMAESTVSISASNPSVIIIRPQKSVPDQTLANSLAEVRASEGSSFNFGVWSLGLESGIGLSNHGYNSSLANGVSASYSGTHGILGARLNWGKVLAGGWTPAVTMAFRYYLGNVKENHNTFTATSQSYKATYTQRYELAAKVGKWMGGLHPYIKMGPVVNKIRLKVSDLNSNFVSTGNQWVWGATVGGGLETEIAQKLLFGGSVDYDRYLMIKNNFLNGNTPVSGYKMTPGIVNFMLTLSWKLGGDQKKQTQDNLRLQEDSRIAVQLSRLTLWEKEHGARSAT